MTLFLSLDMQLLVPEAAFDLVFLFISKEIFKFTSAALIRKCKIDLYHFWNFLLKELVDQT